MTKNSHVLQHVPRQRCFGCAACQSICAQSAIQMSEDAEGFLYPHLDESLCEACGLCLTTCPALHHSENKSIPKAYYACVNRDIPTYAQSSSGAVFPALAKTILARGGVVFGAGFTNEHNKLYVKHHRAETWSQVSILQGSKYVQSPIGQILPQVLQQLCHTIVLFCGTPCQINAVQRLAQQHANLYCLEVVCYGVASPKCYDKYLQTLGNVTQFSFRERVENKGNRFISYTVDGTKKIIPHSLSSFMRLFFENIILRPSCHSCPYTKNERGADITLADLHNTQKKYLNITNNNIASAISINTKKGQELWESVQAEFDFEPTTLSENEQPRLLSPTMASPKREDFMLALNNLPYDQLIDKFIQPSENNKRNLLEQLRMRRNPKSNPQTLEKPNPPHVSVLITCHNYANYLEECIESVLAQSYTNYEIVLVDNASTDNTKEIAQKYPTVRYIYEPKLGVSIARNTALRAALGNYIAFLDADDYWPQNRLSALVPLAEELYPQKTIACGMIHNFFHGQEVKNMPLAHIMLAKSKGEFHALSVIHKNFFANHGVFNENLHYAEDTDLFKRLKLQGINYINYEGIVLHRRLHAQNISLTLRQTSIVNAYRTKHKQR